MKMFLRFGSCAMVALCFLGCFGNKYVTGIDQTAKYRHLYQERLEEGSTLVKAAYHYSIEKTPDGQYIYKQYYPTTRQITHFHTYSEKKMNTRKGKTIEWFDNGHKYYEGNYENNQPEGQWSYYYYKHPLVQNSGSFVDGKKEGEWMGFDTLGQLTSKRQYIKGQLDGVSNWYDGKGKTIASIEYKAGEKIREDNAFYDSIGMKVVEVMPYLASCEQADVEAQRACSTKRLLSYIYKTIKYPSFARKKEISGSALIGFVVEKDGSIQEVEVKRGLCDEIKAECLRVVQNMPKWNPGMQRGKAVRVYFNLPLRFKLE